MSHLTDSSPIVLIGAPADAQLLSGLEERGFVCRYRPGIHGQQEAFRAIQGCQGLITSTRIKVDQGLLEQAPDLRWIGRMGSGMEIIDLEETERRGIFCFSSPEGNAMAVAEHALGMMIALGRRILRAQGELQNGIWQREENRGFELGSKTLGIIGMGHTGKALARLLSGFSTRIIGYDIDPEVRFPEGVQRVSLSQLQNEAEVLSFHVPLDVRTHHYFDRDFLHRMKHPFLLVNTARGPIIDREALVEGMERGQIIGACLDVWEQEPLSRMEERSREVFMKLVEDPRCIITPHIAGYSHEALKRMGDVLLSKLDKIVLLKGKNDAGSTPS